MPKSKGPIGAAFTTLVVPLIAAALVGCSADREQVEVLELAVENDQYAAPDLGPVGTTVGDMYVYSGRGMEDGREVGRGGGSCQVIRVDGEKITTHCLITMELERGSLSLQSLWVTGTSPLDMAITGGTGAYRNARGSVRFWDIATPNERVRAEIVH
jgi:hypothetical protein